MTAELRRGLALAGIGVAGGLAVVAVLFGSGDLLKRVRGDAAPVGMPQRAADLPDTAGQGSLGKDSPGKGSPGKADAAAPAPKVDRPGSQAALDSNAAPDRAPQADSKPAAPAGAADGKGEGEGADKATDKAAPRLDIVRVEPSGDTVLAGRGAPKAKVELLRDGKPVAETTADAAGEFALVPPSLPPGDSALSLRTTAPDGTVTQGRESVAVVVAPDRTTKPLVAVSEPDKPTRVLSQPEAPPVAEARSEPGKATAGQTTTGKATAGKPEAGPTPGQQAATEPGKGPAPKLDLTKPDLTKPDTAKAGETQQRQAALPGAGKPSADKPAPTSPAAAGEALPVKIVSVDAQEGGRLFVAGQATAWTSLRLYLNDTLVASGRSGADGRIAFTIGRGVKAGGYQVRIDQVDGDTGKVRNRAQVAFAFPIQLAAREEADRPGRTPASKPQAAPEPPAAQAAAEPARTAARTDTKPDARTDPKPEMRTDARPEASGTPPAGEGGSRTADRPVPAAKPAVESLSTLERSGSNAGGTETDRPAPLPAPTPLPTPTPLPAPEVPARLAETPAEQAGTVFVPEIATAKIVRGDNLWTISSRTYGNGTRYTVIYDANREQIRDPNLIYPGQIFVLPRDTAPAADRQGARRG